MSTQPSSYLTPEQYLEIERKAEYKSEYFDGQMYAMSGASLVHTTVVDNLTGLLWQLLRGGQCRVLSQDMRVQVGRNYLYPDIIGLCGEAHLADTHFDTLLNPTLIIEVLSPSTERYDRGLKFQVYRKIETLREYLLIAQDCVSVEHYVRQSDSTWLLSETKERTATIELPSLGCSVSVDAVYDRVTFQPASVANS